ncbi:MAG: NYN domain-containing protein [Actinomycetota bacterium]|nr:NYN domain-containing protein [Actinomycetota bacterium]MDQ3532623.1 NYN domain-containing protein [Actinomycetota bacterium]
MADDEERIALFVDFENLAIGARDRGGDLDMSVVMDALSERGRVVVRRAYADWTLFSSHRQGVVAQRIEMIEITQRQGMNKKNAADIKMAVDAIELAFQREFITTFVVASGDSDFTPLVSKLRELNRRVIGIGVEGSTSELLPGACDEFLFYERLVGTGEPPKATRTRARRSGAAPAANGGTGDLAEVSRLVTQTLRGLKRSTDGPVISSMIKRAILRKDPTFSEGDYGFRTWGELLRHLESKQVVELHPGSAEGDPAADFPTSGGGEEKAFGLLRDVVGDLEKRSGSPPLSGLKNELRKRQGGFSEKNYGYSGFLQFAKAASAKGHVDLEWNDDGEDYYLSTVAR